MADIDRVLQQILDDLIRVPGGATVIGSTPQQVDDDFASGLFVDIERSWLLKEIPRHTVDVDTFHIGRVPLTVAQVRTLSGLTGVDPVRDEPGDDHPATVGVDPAFALCGTLSEHLGRTVMLPTEHQWVRAARGDGIRTYPWGDQWRDDAANLVGAGVGHTTPVGSFPAGASPYGVLDLVGNADELTSTIYAPYDDAPPEVPTVETWAMAPYLTKGGGYMHNRDLARIDRRHGIYETGEPLAIRLVVEVND